MEGPTLFSSSHYPCASIAHHVASAQKLSVGKISEISTLGSLMDLTCYIRHVQSRFMNQLVTAPLHYKDTSGNRVNWFQSMRQMPYNITHWTAQKR